MRSIWLLVLMLFTSMNHSQESRTDDYGGNRCIEQSSNRGICARYHYHQELFFKPSSPTGNKIAKNVGPYSKLYNRKEWPHWIDIDKDCQNTRAEILIEHSLAAVTYRNKKKCSVISGSWFDPFSGKTWTHASDVDIDHIVPIKWAHGHGGQNWTKRQKRQFANDFENLLVVENKLNQAKGAKSPDEWMPPNQHFRCEYVAMFNKIVKKYQLEYIPSEKRIIERMLLRCH